MEWAFLALGFLVGNLTGLSDSPIATLVVPTLFTFLGRSILVFFAKVPQSDRPVISRSLAFFCLACLVGTYLGIMINTHGWLGPKSGISSSSGGRYLRANELSEI